MRDGHRDALQPNRDRRPKAASHFASAGPWDLSPSRFTFVSVYESASNQACCLGISSTYVYEVDFSDGG